ncbi:MAG: hypothetical protein R6W83_02540 [Cryobacterium sp.]
MNAAPPHLNRPVAALVSVLVLLIVLSVIVVLSQGPPERLDAATPEGVVQRYASAVIDGDEEQAMQYLVPELRESCEPWDMPSADSMRVTLLATTLRDTTADVRVALVTSSDAGGPFGAPEYRSEEEFDLVRVNGAWLIRSAPWPLTICRDQADWR